jgi:hypothetical protein
MGKFVKARNFSLLAFPASLQKGIDVTGGGDPAIVHQKFFFRDFIFS